MQLIHHVPLTRALKIVGKILTKVDEDQVMIIQDKIKKKAIVNYKHFSVDGSFVLRVLLEYYKVDKK